MKKTAKPFRRLKRLELVELIYQIRKDNVRLERQVAQLKAQLEELEAAQFENEEALRESARSSGGDRLERMEAMLEELLESSVKRENGQDASGGRHAGF